jgi:hypothetical protein
MPPSSSFLEQSGFPLEQWMKHYLHALKRRGLRAGDIVDPNNLPGTPHLLGKIIALLGKRVDVKPGMDYAVEQGWFEKLPGDKYRLTDAGFAAAS